LAWFVSPAPDQVEGRISWLKEGFQLVHRRQSFGYEESQPPARLFHAHNLHGIPVETLLQSLWRMAGKEKIAELTHAKDGSGFE
jgi:hypothetical protein